MESCFSKYKGITKENKTVGISDLSLCLSSMLGENFKEMKNNFEWIKTKEVDKWKKDLLKNGMKFFVQITDFCTPSLRSFRNT